MAIPSFITKWLIKFGLKKVLPGLKDSLLGNNPGEIINHTPNGKKVNALVLIHGFSGNAKGTFTGLPELLAANPEMKGWDIYSLGYSSDIMPSIGIGIWSAIPDITKVSQYLNTTIDSLFKNYKQLSFVAHSMGGLVLQRAVVDLDKNYLDKIKHFFLFGTPSNGLKKASIARWWNRQLRDMSEEGSFVKTLRQNWDDKFKNNYPFSFRAVAGLSDEFVPPKSSVLPFDEKYRKVIPGNHLQIVKPLNDMHLGYLLIVSTITNNASILKSADREDVNLLLADYSDVVNKLLPNAQALDRKGLSKLVFALEGLGRNHEALDILTNHPTSGNESDIMGIIGGRYKRKYLVDFLKQDADMAVAYYQKGLALTLQQNKENKEEQIYYHTINLAFLSLVYKDDEPAMKLYASQALEACKNCQDDIWKLATVAESNMYLGNLADAKTYYKQAAALAGGDLIREKSSIYLNAYIGYQELYKTNDKENEFIKFLEITFL